MAQPDKATPKGFWGSLLQEEARLLPRIRGVLKLDPAVYAEVQADPGSIPQAFVVVIGSALIAGLSSSPYLLFLSIAGLLFTWLVAGSLIWAVATVVTDRDVDYSKVVRCLGFAYVWVTPLLLSQLWFYLGEVVSIAAIGLLIYSFLLATRQVIGDEAKKVCAIALVLPVALLIITLGLR